DFDEMIDFITQSRFERLGVFTYSHEEGTHSFALADNVGQAVKEERAARVMQVQEQISLEINQSRIGNVCRVLVDRREGGVYFGRTEYDSPEVDNEVIIRTDSQLRVGDFVAVKVTDASEFDLIAEPQ